MVGDGDERSSCESLATTLGVAGRIEWTGPIARPAALRQLADCDLLVSPHVPLPDQPFFGSPTKIFEYMALSRPIVASRLGQIGDVLEDRVTARLVTPGDVGELAEVTLEVLKSEDQGRALGRAARREAEAHHTWDQRARSVLDHLKDNQND
jgi:glycosyltransferase involved in cell wall biosynthesis